MTTIVWIVSTVINIFLICVYVTFVLSGLFFPSKLITFLLPVHALNNLVTKLKLHLSIPS